MRPWNLNHTQPPETELRHRNKTKHNKTVSGIILSMGLANERQCYNVTSALIGWAHTQNDHCGYGLSQWETMLQCNVGSHWLSPYPEWSLCMQILSDGALSTSLFLLQTQTRTLEYHNQPTITNGKILNPQGMPNMMTERGRAKLSIEIYVNNQIMIAWICLYWLHFLSSLFQCRNQSGGGYLSKLLIII